MVKETKVKAMTNIFFTISIFVAFFLGLKFNLPFEYTWMLIIMITLFKIELNTQWIGEK